MTVNKDGYETSYSQAAVAWLRERLPAGWEVEPTTQPLEATPDSRNDWAIRLAAPNGIGAMIAVEERPAVSPRSASDLLSPIARRLRSMSGEAPLLVVAPWLSKRTQEVLAEQRINYIDLTGNALLRLDNPPLFIQSDGATRNPQPKQQGRAQLRGAKAGRLIRFLLDVRPPYNVSELAAATRLTPGYVSRLLDTLYREALIERPSRGAVESVDIAGLLRRWADSYDVFRTNETTRLIAPSGSKALLKELARPGPGESPVVVTGSFAASVMAPVAAPSLLIAYCERPGLLTEELALLPSDEGADVILLNPYDSAVFERTEFHDQQTYAAPSQVTVDCLTGNGRMPAEGEALLEWMISHEASWRAPSIAGASWT
jgi:hypothetical protein